MGTIEAAINEVLEGARVLIMQSNGGVATPGIIARAPVQTLMSGPVAGVVGTQWLCREIGRENAISLDVGGTSCDMSVIPGELLTAPQSKVAGYTVRAATVDIETIGSGGGSIARVESGRILKVGPQSAGAVPGPACYGAGDEPTLTDALVVLGHLNREALLNGAMPIEAAAAHRAIADAIAGPLDMTPERAAAGIVEVLAAQVAMSMRSVTIEKGYDPRDFILVAYGGAGPTVACPIAAELEIPEICIPQDPGNFCAAGMLLTDLIRSYSLTRISALDETPANAIREALQELRDKGVQELQEQGVTPDSIDTEDFLDMRYPGQSYEVTVPARETRKEELTRLFHEAHGRLFGHTAEEESMEIVNYRVRCTGRLPKMTFAAAPAGNGTAQPQDQRSALFPGQTTPIPVPVYLRTDLHAGCRIPGPAIIEEYSSTTVVYPELDHVEPGEPHEVAGAGREDAELVDGVLVLVGALGVDAVQRDDDVVAVDPGGGGGGVEHGDVGEGAYDDEVLGAGGTQDRLELAAGEFVEGVGIKHGLGVPALEGRRRLAEGRAPELQRDGEHHGDGGLPDPLQEPAQRLHQPVADLLGLVAPGVEVEHHHGGFRRVERDVLGFGPVRAGDFGHRFSPSSLPGAGQWLGHGRV